MTSIAKHYSAAPFLQRALIAARPLICPPERFLAAAPAQSTVLDIGCGVGANLMALAERGQIRTGHGYDISNRAIAVARAAAARAQFNLVFQTAPHFDALPSGPFDIVMMVDVMHHLPPAIQRDYFLAGARRVAVGGRMVFKDMARKPGWMAFANRLHDLILARQWIKYVPLETVKSWGSDAALRLVDEQKYRKFVYSHELLIFEKP